MLKHQGHCRRSETHFRQNLACPDLANCNHQSDEGRANRDGSGDTSTSRSLQSAEFALLSYGPDKSWDPNVRVDAQGYNKDNIVEAGP